jgi:GNAT superfamily N-acetyltransferase
MPLALRSALESDLPALAQMNQALIEDEGSRNPMNEAQLAERMAGWLRAEPGGWQVRIFEEQATIAGYAVYALRRDQYDPEQIVVYLRQFYIERDQRRRGLGRRAFALLAQTSFPPGCRVDIDVLATNPQGQQFWAALGFKTYSTAMVLGPQDLSANSAP